MDLPLNTDTWKWIAIPMGMVFGLLLHRGGVTDANVIMNQFRLRDWTVLKVMLTAIVVGGAGVLFLHQQGHAEWHIKPATMLGVVIGAALFGIGMVVYGYCPGTGIAATATGSIHGLVGLAGMLVGGVLYALSFPWIQQHILGVADLGKKRLPDLTGIPDWGWIGILAAVALVIFTLLEVSRRQSE
ncbi:MAG: YeeE/YedE family protein [Verrucomicrobiales bacterium]|nr:YeeE/YedE family protein [Verrucomicrobiales bacterium]